MKKEAKVPAREEPRSHGEGRTGSTAGGGVEQESHYHALFANNHAVMLLIDPESGHVIDANPAALKFYGYAYGELTGLHISAINTLSREEVHREMDRARREERRCFSFRHRLADGTERDVEVYSGPINRQGRQLLYSIVHDVTERRRAEEKLAKISQALEFSPVAVMITDRGGRIEYVNRKYREITGYAEEELLGAGTKILKSGLTPPATYRELWETILGGGEWRGELLNRKKSGELFWEKISISPLLDEEGEINHFVAVKEDISEVKRLQEQIWLQAHTDQLTGLPNRILFMQRLRTALAEAQGTRERIALLFLDLDRFKEVNDTLGHDGGDRVLQKAADRVRGSLRETDCAARLGGDEFVLLLREVGGEGGAMRVAEKLRASLARPFRIGGEELRLSASIGVALAPARGADPSSLLREADLAMYEAKQAGRDAVRMAPS